MKFPTSGDFFSTLGFGLASASLISGLPWASSACCGPPRRAGLLGRLRSSAAPAQPTQPDRVVWGRAGAAWSGIDCATLPDEAGAAGRTVRPGVGVAGTAARGAAAVGAGAASAGPPLGPIVTVLTLLRCTS